MLNKSVFQRTRHFCNVQKLVLKLLRSNQNCFFSPFNSMNHTFKSKIDASVRYCPLSQIQTSTEIPFIKLFFWLKLTITIIKTCNHTNKHLHVFEAATTFQTENAFSKIVVFRLKVFRVTVEQRQI